MANNQSASSFTASSTPTDIHNSCDSEDDSAQSDADSALHPIPAKKLCTSSQSVKHCSKSHPMSDKSKMEAAIHLAGVQLRSPRSILQNLQKRGVT